VTRSDLRSHPDRYVLALTSPMTTTDRRFRWSVLVWSPPPESNRRSHPYHRCAGGSQRRTAPHVTRQPRRWEGASESRDVGRDAVTRSAVSANFWHGQLELEMDTTPQRHLPGRPREDHTHLRCGAVLGTIFGSCVERAGEASSLMAGAGPWPVKCCDGPCRWVSSGPSLNRHRVDKIVARLQAVEWPTAMADFLLADAAGQQPL
jgi:hypothetical protein